MRRPLLRLRIRHVGVRRGLVFLACPAFLVFLAIVMSLQVVVAPVRSLSAMHPRTLAVAHLLQAKPNGRAPPCGRLAPELASSPPVDGRYGLPEAFPGIVPAPDSLQIVPDLHLT